MDESQAWLEWLYGERPDGLIWIGGHGDGWAGRTFTSIPDAVAYARQLDEQAIGGVYHRLTTMRAVEEGRGAAVDSAYLPGFAMDLDLKGPGHKALNYPETDEDLITLLRKADLPEPSAWVHSGGGRYPFWRLEQPADLTLPGQLERAATLSRRIHKHVIAWAKDAGWKVDNTSDLARVYRLPGTHNRKVPGKPVMCRVMHPNLVATSRGYALEELEAAIALAEDPPTPWEQAPPSVPPSLPAGEASQLFATPGEIIGNGPRRYTLSQAMAFVQPALDALRSAQDGEINNRLNDAAIALAHFGEDFWSREAAEGQLRAALAHTVYDGATWQAEDTIRSAYAAMAARVGSGPDYWLAERVPDLTSEPADAPADAVDALLAEMLHPSDLRDRPPQPYLIKGWLKMPSESWLIGAPGSRKSFVALSMAADVAAGHPWQGIRTRQGKVVIIAAEGAAGLGGRINAWERETGRRMSEDVHILPRPVQASNAAAWSVLIKACERIQPALIIVDTQARVTVGLKENDATDLGIYIAAASALKAASGACVLTIHHTGRNGQDARGTSAMDGAQDSELKVVALPEPLRGELRHEKQKDLEEGAPLPLVFAVHQVGVDEDGDPVTSLALRDMDAWQAASGVRVDEVEPWESGHAEVIVQLFKVLRDQGEHAGLTKAEAKAAVVERFYKPQGRTLNRATWFTGWDRAMKKTAAGGDPVMINVGGQRWTVDAVALAGLEPAS